MIKDSDFDLFCQTVSKKAERIDDLNDSVFQENDTPAKSLCPAFRKSP